MRKLRCREVSDLSKSRSPHTVGPGLNSHHLGSEFALKSYYPDCLSVSSEKKRAGTYIYLWLIHVDVWQKPTPYFHYPSVKNKDKIKNKEFMVKKVEPQRKNTSTECFNHLKQFSAMRQIVQSGERSPEPPSCTWFSIARLHSLDRDVSVLFFVASHETKIISRARTMFRLSFCISVPSPWALYPSSTLSPHCFLLDHSNHRPIVCLFLTSPA